MSDLCLACGLCCDGSLFGYVPLQDRERAMASRRGLRVLASGNGFEQPCSAHHAGACAVYAERPRACRAFECKLHARGGNQQDVTRVRELLGALAAQDLTPADFDEDDVEPAARALYDELMERLERDFARADPRAP